MDAHAGAGRRVGPFDPASGGSWTPSEPTRRGKAGILTIWQDLSSLRRAANPLQRNAEQAPGGPMRPRYRGQVWSVNAHSISSAAALARSGALSSTAITRFPSRVAEATSVSPASSV